MGFDLSEADAANELMRLAKQIAYHNKRYHAEDSPEISDADYDALVRRNAELEAKYPHLVRPDSPSRQVGHEVAASPLAKVPHEVRTRTWLISLRGCGGSWPCQTMPRWR